MFRIVLASLAAAVGLAAVTGAAPSERETALRARGRTLFEVSCARCHGEDGGDTSLYPNVKSLVDVAQRLTRAEVLQKSQGFAGLALQGEEGEALYAHLETLRSGQWARPELLVETSWAAAHAGDPQVRLVDLRPAAEYAAGHLPGAVRVDPAPLRDPRDRELFLPSAGEVTTVMRRAGIGPATHVVAYDGSGGLFAARLWLLLSQFGHPRVSLLNGGFGKWNAEGRPVSREAPMVPGGTFAARPPANLVCSAAAVLSRPPALVLIDARTPEEHRGERAGGAAKAGRVPGARHWEWRQALTGPYSVFRPGPELRRELEQLGITPEREIVTYCTVGLRAAHALFTLNLLGYPKARVYFGSMADYTARENAPLEKDP